ncbi:MAG: hypothetical protein WB989_21580, partial [Mycobacterium sp.]
STGNPAYSVVLLDRAAGERSWTDYDGRRRARSLRAQGNRFIGLTCDNRQDAHQPGYESARASSANRMAKMVASDDRR